jgi:hypothetical protein
MESLGRSDPKHPAFGLVAWGRDLARVADRQLRRRRRPRHPLHHPRLGRAEVRPLGPQHRPRASGQPAHHRQARLSGATASTSPPLSSTAGVTSTTPPTPSTPPRTLSHISGRATSGLTREPASVNSSTKRAPRSG